jgi:hypothetical protein
MSSNVRKRIQCVLALIDYFLEGTFSQGNPMEQSNAILIQAADLIKAGKKQEAVKLLRNLLQSEPGNARAWGILSMAVDDVEERREALQGVADYGDTRMSTWARQELAKLPPPISLFPPSEPLFQSPDEMPQSLADFEIPDAPAPIQPAAAAPAGPSAAGRARRLVMTGVVILVVAFLLLILVFLLPTIQSYLATRPTETPRPTATETARPTRAPRPTSTITDTPSPAPTRTPRPTPTPSPTETETPTPGPSPTPSRTPTVTRTPTPTRTPTVTKTATTSP